MSWVWPIRTLVVGGESTSCLLVMGEQGSVCTSGQVQEGSGVWGLGQAEKGWKQDGVGWLADGTTGPWVLGVQDGVQCGDGPGQCGTTAHMLEGRGQYPVPEGLWLCRCPWAS